MNTASAKTKETAFSKGVYFTMAALAVYGALLCFFKGLEFPRPNPVFGGAGVGLVLLLVVYLLQKKRRTVLLCAAGAFVLSLLLLWRGLAQGAVYVGQWVWAKFIQVFPEFGVANLPLINLAASSRVFLFFCGLALGALVCWAVLWRKSGLLCALFVLPPFLFVVNMYGITHVPGTVMLAAAGMALLCKGQGKTRKSPNASAKLSATALALAGLYFVGVVLLQPVAAYRANPVVFGLRRDISNFANDVYNGTAFGPGLGINRGGPLSGRRGNVNLMQTGELRLTDDVALRISGNVNSGTYLRGYSAAIYTGSGWQQLPEEDYSGFDFNPLVYAPPYGYNPLPYDMGYASTNELKIELVNANPAYAYTPYYLAGFQQTEDQAAFEFVQDAFIRPPQNTAAYTTLQYNYALSPQNAIASGYLLSSSMVETYTTEGGDVVYYVSTDSSYLPVSNYWVNSQQQASLTEEEKEYISFIQETYLQLPEGVGDDLRTLALQMVDLQPAKTVAEWPLVASMVASLVKDMGVYTRNPGAQPRSEDFALYFLTQSRKGYCVHFATAATAMLRALGVPARYVEGYFSSLSVSGQNWTDVLSKNAHAWVEIWVPNLGWIPVEVTPGGADIYQPQNTGQVSAPPPISISQNEPEASSSSETPEDSSALSQSEGMNGTNGTQGNPRTPLPPWLRWVLAAAVGIAALVVALFVLYRHIATSRRRRFAQGDTNKGALAAYSYLMKLQPFGYVPEKDIVELAGKARFSQHKLSQKERKTMVDEAVAARAEVCKELSWHKKLWLKILAL